MKIKVIYILFVFLLFGCSQKEDIQEKKLKTLVSKYIIALELAYEEQQFEDIGAVADFQEARKVALLASNYYDIGNKMELDILSFKFGDVKYGEKRATVRTEETWKYRWYNYKTNEEVFPMKKVKYRTIYHIKKEGLEEDENIAEVIEHDGEIFIGQTEVENAPDLATEKIDYSGRKWVVESVEITEEKETEY